MITTQQVAAPDAGLMASFQARAEAVSATVHRVPDREAALVLIRRLLAAEGVSSAPGCHAVWAPCPFLEGLSRGPLVEAGIRFDVTRETAASARAGVTQTDLAVADTGSVVVASSAIEQRLASSLPPLHVALAPSRALVPDLAAVLQRFSPREFSYLTLITGPSRTADIERVLTIGVHGPARLHIVFVDEL
jgi:L-lactate dehydrogenase complex protein LldG